MESNNQSKKMQLFTSNLIVASKNLIGVIKNSQWERKDSKVWDVENAIELLEAQIQSKEVVLPPVPLLLKQPSNGLTSDSVIAHSLQASKPPIPEQPLPEELVSKHLESTWDNILRSKSDYGETSAKITLDYMGRVLEQCDSIVIDGVTWQSIMKNKWAAKNYPWATTPQLIELFFNQQNK